MLQGLNLPFIEISSLETSLNYSVSLQGQGLEPATVFADIFKLEPQALVSLQSGAGNPLPPGGNILPQRLNDVPVTATIDDFETDLLQPEVLATNPLPIEALIPVSVPVQVALVAGNSAALPAASTTVSTIASTIAHSLPPASAEAVVNSLPQAMEGAVQAPADGRARVQVGHERANLLQSPNPGLHQALPLAEANIRRVGTEQPVLPLSGEAIASVLEQVAPGKKVPTRHPNMRPAIDPVSPPKSFTDVTRDDSVQSIRPAPTAPIVSQLSAIAPVAGNHGDVGQQVQVSPLQVTPAANRIVADSTAAPPPSLGLIDTAVSEPAWGDRVGDRLLLMANNRMQSAEIRLTPAELGPLRVRISVDDGAATVTFNAQHAVTREAIEQAMPRLRELFAENGLNLQQGSTAESDGHGVQQGKQEHGQATAGAAVSNADEDSLVDGSSTELTVKPRSDKLVDTFA